MTIDWDKPIRHKNDRACFAEYAGHSRNGLALIEVRDRDAEEWNIYEYKPGDDWIENIPAEPETRRMIDVARVLAVVDHEIGLVKEYIANTHTPAGVSFPRWIEKNHAKIQALSEFSEALTNLEIDADDSPPTWPDKVISRLHEQADMEKKMSASATGQLKDRHRHMAIGIETAIDIMREMQP